MLQRMIFSTFDMNNEAIRNAGLAHVANSISKNQEDGYVVVHESYNPIAMSSSMVAIVRMEYRA